MCRFSRVFWMKKSQQVSRLSAFSPAAFTSPRIELMISSLSSKGKRSGISPDDSKSLMRTKNFSSVICESVKRKRMPSPLRPARLYIF